MSDDRVIVPAGVFLGKLAESADAKAAAFQPSKTPLTDTFRQLLERPPTEAELERERVAIAAELKGPPGD